MTDRRLARLLLGRVRCRQLAVERQLPKSHIKSLNRSGGWARNLKSTSLAAARLAHSFGQGVEWWRTVFARWEMSTVPELSRFFGIIIRMYMEAGGPHHLPHFHAYYQDDVAVVGLDPIDIIAGHLPRRQRRFVEAWAELHQQELIADWDRLQDGESPLPIAPLE